MLQELQERETYTKPSVKRRLAKKMAVKRWRKHVMSQTLAPKTH